MGSSDFRAIVSKISLSHCAQSSPTSSHSASMAAISSLKPSISMPRSLHLSFTAPSLPNSIKTLKDFHSPRLLPMRIKLNRIPPLSLSRRLFVPSVSGIWDALTGGNNPRDAVAAIRRGMLRFRQGDVSGSLAEFDKAIELDPRQKAYLWQRGLSLYYLDRFEEGAEQFRLDVAQNPNDTEESIWCFLCEAHLYGVDEARGQFLEVGRDPRPVMGEAYNMFKDGGHPEKLVAAFSSGRENELFYASLYAGLYHESELQNEDQAFYCSRVLAHTSSWKKSKSHTHIYPSVWASLFALCSWAILIDLWEGFARPKKKMDAAKQHIVAACQSPYGQRSDDYMAALAQVHCFCRNWNFS